MQVIHYLFTVIGNRSGPYCPQNSSFAYTENDFVTVRTSNRTCCCCRPCRQFAGTKMAPQTHSPLYYLSTLVCPTYSSWIPLYSTSLKWNEVEYAYIRVFIPVQYVSVQFIPVYSSPLLSSVLWSRVFQSSPFQSIPVYYYQVYFSLLCFSPVYSSQLFLVYSDLR